MLTGPQVIIILKIAVGLVTVLLVASAVALALRKPRLHGRINTLMTTLTLVTVLGFEVLIRIVGIPITEGWDEHARFALNVHLCFVIPLVPILLWMLISGWKRRIRMHLMVSVVFIILWIGMFVSGMFYLPHE